MFTTREHDVFRRWLVGRVGATRWSDAGRSLPMAKRTARQLGLHWSVLVDAYAKKAAQRRAAGLQETLGRKRAGTPHHQIEMTMPKEVFDSWHTRCELLGLESSAVLRSLLHAYLLGPQEPEPRSRWLVHGKWVSVPTKLVRPGGKDGPPWPYREKALITRGARMALRRRADRMNVSTWSIMRGLIVDFTSGKIRDVAPVDARTMWDDPDRYWKGCG